MHSTKSIHVMNKRRTLLIPDKIVDTVFKNLFIETKFTHIIWLITNLNLKIFQLIFNTISKYNNI